MAVQPVCSCPGQRYSVRWTNLLIGMAGAVIGGELFRLFRIDFGLGELKVTFEDLIAAFLGSLLVIFAWRIIAKSKAKGLKENHPKAKPACVGRISFRS